MEQGPTQPKINIAPEESIKTIDLYEDMVARCSSFDELYALIDRIGIVKGDKRDYIPEYLKEIIEDVRNGRLGISSVTNTHTIQLTVEHLLGSDLVYQKFLESKKIK